MTWRKREGNTGRKQDFKKTRQWEKPDGLEETQGGKVNQ